MDIQLIKAQKNDVDFLYDLRMQTMSVHLEKAGVNLSKEEHYNRVNHHLDNAHVIMESDQKIGLLKLDENDSDVEILQLQILPEHQGKGIGKHLIDSTIERAKQENKEVKLKVLKRNPAKFLYLRNGFNIVGQDDLEFHMKYM